MNEVKRKRMFFDIETSPNVALTWRAGYKITIDFKNIVKERAIICICWKWEGQKAVHSVTWDKDQDDKAALSTFLKELAKADEAIAHNGDRFDIKWVRTRALIHGLEMGPNIQTIDTLTKVRKYFYFNSNRLDYVAQFLGVGKKTEGTSFDLWKKVTLDNDLTALKKMVRYCKNDVVILEKVYDKLKTYIDHSFNYATLSGGERWQCPECGSKEVVCNKTRTTKYGLLKREMKCKGCNKSYTISNLAYTQLLEYRETKEL
jgi:uncharacterized protein YprB with RNaseH-like and TPR domain